MDPSFEILYPQHAWLGENVLHFYRGEYFSRDAPDTLIVVNSSNEAINYLKVETSGAFLLFDVQPGSVTKLIDSPSRGDLKWISVEGEFSRERRMKWKGVDFILPKGISSSSPFYIYVNHDKTEIENPQMEKYRRTE